MPAGMEEKNMRKFKVGDHVRVIVRAHPCYGRDGVVIFDDKTKLPYRVFFEDTGITAWFTGGALELIAESESKHSPGDKFVIEIESVITAGGGTLYKIKGFNALVFDDFGIGRLERYDKPAVNVSKLDKAKERLTKASNEAEIALNEIINAIAKEDSNELPY